MQGILVFASATARDAAITSPEEGQFAFLKDTNVTTYYTGSAWANVDTTGMTNPMTTTGDVIYSSSGSTPARLGIGTAGQVLQVNSGATAPEWASPASGGGMTLLSTTTLSGSTTSVTSISSSYVDLVIHIEGATLQTNAGIITANFNSGTTLGYYNAFKSDDTISLLRSNASIPLSYGETAGTGISVNSFAIQVSNYASTSSRKPITFSGFFNAFIAKGIWGGGGFDTSSAISSFQLILSAGTFSGGTLKIYGVK
jgi:hypothetical protein